METKYLHLLLVGLFLSGCGSYNKNDVFEEIDYKNESRIDISNIKSFMVNKVPLKTTRYIELETEDQFLIGQVSKILINNDYIYVSDEDYSKALFIFDINGKFVKKIGIQGRGPQECINMNNFDVDQKGHIYIHDQGGSKIIKYSQEGDFVEIFRIPFLTRNFSVLNENAFILQVGNSENIKKDIYGLSNYSLHFWNPYKKEILKSFFPYQGDKIEIYGGWVKRFFRSGEELNYIAPYQDIIFRIDEEGIHSRNVFDFGDNKLSKENFNSLSKSEIRENKIAGKLGSLMDDYYETDRFISFRFHYLGLTNKYIFTENKNSGIIKIFSPVEILKSENIKKIIGPISVKGVYNNQFISVIEGVTLSSFIRSAKENKAMFNRKFGHLEGYDLLQNMKEGSNPLIILYDYDDF